MSWYDNLNTINVRKRNYRKHTPLTLEVFPENPDDFRRMFPTQYKEGKPPVPSRLNASMIDELIAMTPARKSNALIKDDKIATSPNAVLPVSASGNANITGNANFMNMMQQVQPAMAMLGQFMGMMQNNGAGNHDVPGFRFCQGGGNARFDKKADQAGCNASGTRAPVVPTLTDKPDDVPDVTATGQSTANDGEEEEPSKIG